jgi:hypothetical protein
VRIYRTIEKYSLFAMVRVYGMIEEEGFPAMVRVYGTNLAKNSLL